MKKQILLLIIVLLIKIYIPIKPYIECNDLSIITEIEVICSDKYTVIYKETIPERDDNGIEYKYKTYKASGNNLKEVINRIEYNKNIYKEKAKLKIKNCNDIKKEDLIS